MVDAFHVPEAIVPSVVIDDWPAYVDAMSMASADTLMRLAVPAALIVVPDLVRPSPACMSLDPVN